MVVLVHVVAERERRAEEEDPQGGQPAQNERRYVIDPPLVWAGGGRAYRDLFPPWLIPCSSGASREHEKGAPHLIPDGPGSVRPRRILPASVRRPVSASGIWSAATTRAERALV